MNSDAMNKRYSPIQITLLYGLSFAMFYCCFAAIRSFISVFLADRGFTYTQIGVITAVHMLVSALIQPCFGPILDRFPKLSLQRFTELMILLAIAATAALMVVPPTMPGYLLIYIFLAIGLPGLAGVMISLGMEYLNHGISLNLGVGRSMGSLGYALASAVFGTLVARYGSFITIRLNLILLTAFLLLVHFLPEVKRSEETPEETEPTDPLPVFIRSNGLYSLFLLSNVFLFIGHCFQTTYLPQICEQFNIGSDTVGILIGISAGVELIPMIFYERLSKKVSPLVLLCVSGFGFSLKMICAAAARNTGGLAIASLMQMAAYGIFSLPAHFFTNQAVAPRNRVMAQGLLMMVNEMGFTFGGLIGGIVLDHYPVRKLLWLGVMLTLIGTGMLLYSILKFRKKSQQSLS